MVIEEEMKAGLDTPEGYEGFKQQGEANQVVIARLLA